MILFLGGLGSFLSGVAKGVGGLLDKTIDVLGGDEAVIEGALQVGSIIGEKKGALPPGFTAAVFGGPAVDPIVAPAPGPVDPFGTFGNIGFDVPAGRRIPPDVGANLPAIAPGRVFRTPGDLAAVQLGGDPMANLGRGLALFGTGTGVPRPSGLPGGAPVPGVPGFDPTIPAQMEANPLLGAFFQPTMAGLRARRGIEVRNPLTGRIAFFRNMGRPMLFSGDLAACRRVSRVASRARRRRPR